MLLYLSCGSLQISFPRAEVTQPFANVRFLLGFPQDLHGKGGMGCREQSESAAANTLQRIYTVGLLPSAAGHQGGGPQKLMTAPSAEQAHLLFAALVGVCKDGPKSQPRDGHRTRYLSSCSMDLREQNVSYWGSAKTETRAGHVVLTWQVHLGTLSEMLYTVWHRKISHLYSPGTPTPSMVALNPLFFSSRGKT